MRGLWSAVHADAIERTLLLARLQAASPSEPSMRPRLVRLHDAEYRVTEGVFDDQARHVFLPFSIGDCVFGPIPLPVGPRPLRAPVPPRTPSPKPPFSTDPAGIEVER
jgi:hypothetical protein